MQFTTRPDVPQPHLDVQGDMGAFAYAVHQMPPGRAYMAAGTVCTWPAFLAAWSRVTGVAARYEQVSLETMVAAAGDEELGMETALMFCYSSDPGYDGGMQLLTADDIRKVSFPHRPIGAIHLLRYSTTFRGSHVSCQAGIECPMTSWEDWAARHDWSVVLKGGTQESS